MTVLNIHVPSDLMFIAQYDCTAGCNRLWYMMINLSNTRPVEQCSQEW